jgi:hypothetical protein
MDAPSFERTWLQHMCCALITPDVLICRKRKERFSGKGENNRKRGWNYQVDFQTRVTGILDYIYGLKE